MGLCFIHTQEQGKREREERESGVNLKGSFGVPK